jgi:hypothetical protein
MDPSLTSPNGADRMVSFRVMEVCDLGATIHVIGIVENGAIGPGSSLHDSIESNLILKVSSIAIGGRIPEGTVTLVVEELPCDANSLSGRTFYKD